MTWPRSERDTASAKVTARTKKPARIPPAKMRLRATSLVDSVRGASTDTRISLPTMPGAVNVA
jgi:hypothetical protein